MAAPPLRRLHIFSAYFLTLTLLATTPLQSIDPNERLDGRSSFSSYSDSQLWQAHREAEAARTVPASFVVGLKQSNSARGVDDGIIQLTREQIEQAEHSIALIPGVRVTWTDPAMPIVHVSIDSIKALGHLRRHPVVDYVEPLNIPVDMFSLGCELRFWDYSRALDFLPGTSEVIPWNFLNHSIPQAWGRTAGAGVTLGVVDTGAYATQSQLWRNDDPRATQSGRFNVPLSGRTAQHAAYTQTGSVFDVCSHGTRVATTATAPRDGRNIVGVAHEANLVSVRAADGVVAISNVESFRIAIIRARDLGAKVIVMAWGTASNVQSLKNTIDAMIAESDVVFVAAAGTIPLGGGIHCTGVYPSIYDNVLSVTGMWEGTNSFHPDACRGSTTDLVIDIAEVPAGGRYENDIVHFGGTSNGAAVVGGIAALVRSQYPSMTSAQVRSRLKNTATPLTPYTPGSGFGRLNAYKAVGGFMSLHINGPTTPVSPGGVYQLSSTKSGDGPFQHKWVDGSCSLLCAESPQCASTCPSLGTSSSLARNAPSTGGQSQTSRVIVTDLVDNTQKVASYAITSGTPCQRLTCETVNVNPPFGAMCGSISDGCGGRLDCGSCETGEICRKYMCLPKF